MAEDRTPDPADQPEDDETQPREKPPEPYRLGGSGGSGKTPQGPSGKSGGEPDNPFEAFLSSLAGGDVNALAAQLQSAFSMLGGAGSMFTSGPTQPGSGVNWDVTKDTARKTVAALGPDPSPDARQRRAITEAVELAEIWLDQATRFPRVSTTVAAWSRAEWIDQTMPVWQRLVEPVALHIGGAMEGALSVGRGGGRQGGWDRPNHAGLAAACGASRPAHCGCNGRRTQLRQRRGDCRPPRNGRHGEDAAADATDLGANECWLPRPHG